MKNNYTTLALLLVFAFGFSASAQYPGKIDLSATAAHIKADENEKQKDLDKRVYWRPPLNGQKFRELVYADFSKLLLIDNSTGKPISYANVTVTKPTAELSYAYSPTKFGFLNINLKGGYESDALTLVSEQKPAKSYAANFTYSYVLWHPYGYNGHENYKLKAKTLNAFDKNYYLKDEAAKAAKNSELGGYSKQLDDLYSYLEKNKDNASAADTAEKKEQIRNLLVKVGEISDQIDTLAKHITKKKYTFDSLQNTFQWQSKRYIWLTASQKIAGTSFYHYNASLPAESVKDKVSRSTYETSIAVNGYYKSSRRGPWQNLIRNTLFSIGFSIGHFNDFSELVPSDLKVSAKTDVGGSSYTKGESYTIYDLNKLKSYHGTKLFVEYYRMFSRAGSFGLHAKWVRFMPEKSNILINTHTNLETGIIFNALKKTDKGIDPKSTISFELYYNLNDLGGKNPEVSGKFYKRNEIGVKTAIPFNFD